MEVESTQVHVRPDGKKLIDVTLRRQEVPPQQALVVPQFDDDDDSSSSDDEAAIESLFFSSVHHTSGTSNNNEEDNHDQSADELSHTQPQQTFKGEIQWDRVQELQELTNANATLTAEARDLRQQVKTLQIQLEAQAPVPGLDIDAVQDILLEKDTLDHDVRDVKIVHQAKTIRALKRSLQREKQLAADATKHSKALETVNKQLEEEVDTLRLKLQRFQARSAAEKSNNEATKPPKSPTESHSDTSSEGGSLKKLCDELKAKNIALQQELKKTQRALVREVGEDVSLEEIVGNTDSTTSGASRRGRAQQIFMLKAKVKKLQSRLRPGTSSTELHATGNVLDVDQRAQQDLSGQQMHRQKLLDQLTSQRDELQERLHRLTRNYDALKARAQILDREKHETRDKFQVLVDKSRTDDALVDALQRQLETWKTKLHEARRARTADATRAASLDERVELERLRKIVAEHKSRAGDKTASGTMPQPSEISQYRAIAMEKERLTEMARSLKAQLEDKEKQLRSLQESHISSDLASQMPIHAPPPSPSLPPIGDEGISRIPRRRGSRIPLPSGKSGGDSVSDPPPPSAVTMEQQQQQLKLEMETLRKTFRETMRKKDGRIAELERQQLQSTSQSDANTAADADMSAMSQQLQELQEENDFLRQEFDKLKTRYEALVQPSAAASRKKSRSKDK